MVDEKDSQSFVLNDATTNFLGGEGRLLKMPTTMIKFPTRVLFDVAYI